ncbi:MAG TPA: phosphatase PAP2 family protein [Candidatus Paceibacterota bacterium]|nr:phosphatase PAP2 family protein [Candidatus Paceibacterota bacterium]
MSLDLTLFNLLYGFASTHKVVGLFIGFMANYAAYFLVAAFIWFVFQRGNWKERIYIASLAIISIIIGRGIFTELFGFFLYRVRPYIALGLPALGLTTGSFPSGHMAFLMPIALIVWSENKRLGKWFLGGTVLIGVSRVAYGYHWPSDILGGIVVGATFFYLTKKFLPK